MQALATMSFVVLVLPVDRESQVAVIPNSMLYIERCREIFNRANEIIHTSDELG